MANEKPHLFPDTFYTSPLDSWAIAIQRLPREAKECLLDQVVHYKALSDMEHEYLIIFATHPSGSKIVLGVDRNANDPKHGPQRVFYSSSVSSSTTPSPSLESPDAGPRSESKLEAAYDGVQVSHDGTPAPIIAQHGPSVQLSTVSFASPGPTHVRVPQTGSSTSDPTRPSLLHLSVLLLAIREHFPSYSLFQYQCYFFACATCLALVDVFGGVETVLEDGRRVGTWRGVHVSSYEATCTAFRHAVGTLLLYPLPTAVALAVYGVVKLCDGGMDKRRIRYDSQALSVMTGGTNRRS